MFHRPAAQPLCDLHQHLNQHQAQLTASLHPSAFQPCALQFSFAHLFQEHRQPVRRHNQMRRCEWQDLNPTPFLPLPNEQTVEPSFHQDQQVHQDATIHHQRMPCMTS